MTGSTADEAGGSNEAVIRDALCHIAACQAHNIPNVRINLPDGGPALMRLVIQAVREAGYLAQPGEANEFVKVAIPAELLPGDPKQADHTGRDPGTSR